MKALFLDRDGTIIYDRHYLSDPAGVELVPGAAGALRRALELGFQLFLFTNQSGVGRGLYTLDDVRACNSRMLELLGLPDPVFAGVCIAPEGPGETPVYRKPSPRYILEMVARHGLDPAACLMVGDRPSDWQAGLNAGLPAAAVRTGEPIDAPGERWLAERGVALYDDLAAVVASLG